MTDCVRKSIALLTLALVNSCSTTSSIGYDVELSQNAIVTIGDGKPFSMKKGAKFNTEGKHVLVESPGHIGMLIVPGGESTGKVKISLKTFDKWSGPYLEAKTNKALSEVLQRVHEVQEKMAT